MMSAREVFGRHRTDEHNATNCKRWRKDIGRFLFDELLMIYPKGKCIAAPTDRGYGMVASFLLLLLLSSAKRERDEPMR